MTNTARHLATLTMALAAFLSLGAGPDGCAPRSHERPGIEPSAADAAVPEAPRPVTTRPLRER